MDDGLCVYIKRNIIVISRPITVVLGVDSMSDNEPTKQEFRVLRSIPHPNNDELSNDIMLLKVRASIS